MPISGRKPLSLALEAPASTAAPASGGCGLHPGRRARTRRDTVGSMSTDGTLILQPRAKELRLEGFSLTVIEGPEAGASLRAKTSEVSVGTAQGNDLVL